MNKFLLVCITTAGVCGQFAMANAAPASGQPPAYTAAAPATAMTQDAPYHLAYLQGEVQVLQSEVQNLQNQSSTQDYQSAADPDTIADPYDIGTGG
jgi:hypothetical protein